MCRESIIGKLETEETAWSSQEIFSSCLLARTLTRYVEMAIPSGGKMAETSSWLLTYVNHPHPLQRCLGKEVVFNTTIHCSKKKITSTLRLKFKKKTGNYWQMEDLYILCAINRYHREFTTSVLLPELQILLSKRAPCSMQTGGTSEAVM